LGLLFSLGLALPLLRFAARLAPRPGLAAALYGLGLALTLFGLSFLRVDPAPRWLNLRPDAWGALPLALALACAALLTLLTPPPAPPPS
jgi:hypothetical protein